MYQARLLYYCIFYTDNSVPNETLMLTHFTEVMSFQDGQMFLQSLCHMHDEVYICLLHLAALL